MLLWKACWLRLDERSGLGVENTRHLHSLETVSAFMMELIEFHGDTIAGVRDDDGVIWGVLKRFCENLGISHESQLKKLKKERWAVMVNMTTTGPDGKQYDTSCIRIDKIPMWLVKIDARRIRPELRPKLHLYQDEATEALAQHWGVSLLRPATPTQGERRQHLDEMLGTKLLGNQGSIIEKLELVLNNQAQDHELLKMVADFLVGERENFAPWVIRTGAHVIREHFSGKCPITGELIVDAMGFPLKNFHAHHWQTMASKAKRATWDVFFACSKRGHVNIHKDTFAMEREYAGAFAEQQRWLAIAKRNGADKSRVNLSRSNVGKRPKDSIGTVVLF